MRSVENQATGKVSELTSIYQGFGVARNEYSDLIRRLEVIGHKLSDTNYPAKDGTGGPEEEQRPGIISDLENELQWFQKQNTTLKGIVTKLEDLI